MTIQVKKWIENNGCYELHFTPFYDDTIILRFVRDKIDATCWWYTSELLKVEHDCTWEDSLEEAKESFEEMVLSHYGDQVIYNEELVRKFSSGE